MSASEAAVKAVMDRMGCERSGDAFTVSTGLMYDCLRHASYWTGRGCGLAAQVADAAVDADRPGIQADTLREAITAYAQARQERTSVTFLQPEQWLWDRAAQIEARR